MMAKAPKEKNDISEERVMRMASACAAIEAILNMIEPHTADMLKIMEQLHQRSRLYPATAMVLFA